MVMSMKPNDEMEEEQDDNLLNEEKQEFVVTHFDGNSGSGEAGPIVMSEAKFNPVDRKI